MRRSLLILILLALAPLALAQDEDFYFADFPEGFRADHFHYDKANQLVEASGSVEVTVPGGRVRADRVRVDLKSRLATAEGDIVFYGDDFAAGTDWVFYDISAEAVSLPNIRAEYFPPSLPGQVYFSADNIKVSKDSIKSGPGTLTTCGYTRPHYHVMTSAVDYEKGKSFAGGNATIYAGDLPVFWLPYMVFNFARVDKRDLEVGNNQVEGNYAKSSWGFSRGRLLVDYISNKGLGYGGSLVAGSGEAYLYHIEEKDTGISDWIDRIRYQRDISPQTNLQFTQSYVSSYQVPSGRLEQTMNDLILHDPATVETWRLDARSFTDRIGLDEKYSVFFNRHVEDRATDYYYNYDYSLGDTKWLQTSSRYTNSLPLIPDRVFLSTDIDYFRNVNQLGDSGQEKVEPMLELTGSEPNFNWRLTRNWVVDLRQDLYPGQTRYDFLEKQPEGELAVNPIDLNIIILQPTIGFGSYRESRFIPGINSFRDFSAQRYRGGCDLFRTFNLGLGTDVLLGLGLDQYLYSSRDKLYAYREAATVQSDLGLFFRNTVSYRKGYTRGNSPFFFDRLGTDFHDIYDRMVFYHLDQFAWAFEGGRNWQTGKWFDLVTRLSVSPNQKLSYGLNAGWDVENRRYKDLSSSLTLFPVSYFSAEAMVLEDPNTGAFKSASTSYRLTIWQGEPNQLFAEVNSGYEPTTNEMRVRDIMLVKDLHCWQMKYTYSDYLKQFSITFTLKAMPGEPLGFDNSRGFYNKGLMQGYLQ